MLHFDSLPLCGIFDVVVIGGGTAGFAAGVAASARGAATLIVEERAYLGGTSTGGMTSQFMGFCSDETTASVGGVFGELLRRLVAEGASEGIRTIYLGGMREMDVLAAPYDALALKRAMDRMAVESGACVLLHTRFVGLAMNEAGGIDYIVVHNVEGLQRVKASVYIDASFHGSVAADAGCPWALGDEGGASQPATLIYKTAGADAARFSDISADERARLVQSGMAEESLFFGSLIARPLPDGTMYSSMGRVPLDPLDAASVTRAEMLGREQARRTSDFFRRNVPGFERARLVGIGDFIGQRDSRRILGQYVLSRADIERGTSFADTVVSSSYPVDIHSVGSEPSRMVKPKNGLYHIPYRCMIGAVPNLILAGRCISTDHIAHSCIRVMTTCMRIGEAAGIAASLCAASGVDANALDGRTILTNQMC